MKGINLDIGKLQRANFGKNIFILEEKSKFDFKKICPKFLDETRDAFVITNNNGNANQPFYVLAVETKRVRIITKTKNAKREAEYHYESDEYFVNQQKQSQDFSGEFGDRVEKIVREFLKGKVLLFEHKV